MNLTIDASQVDTHSLRAKFSYWYCRTHPRRTPKLEAFVLLPLGSSMGRSELLVKRHLDTDREMRFTREYTVAEVETYHMMTGIPIIDLTSAEDIMELEPDQGYRDERGQPIPLLDYLIVAGTVQKARSAALDP